MPRHDENVTLDKISAFEAVYRNLGGLRPVSLRVTDESHLHKGHPEAANGCHLKLDIVSDRFEGLTLAQRHRLVYETVGDLPGQGIHALSITAQTPQEKAQPKPEPAA